MMERVRIRESGEFRYLTGTKCGSLDLGLESFDFLEK